MFTHPAPWLHPPFLTRGHECPSVGEKEEAETNNVCMVHAEWQSQGDPQPVTRSLVAP